MLNLIHTPEVATYAITVAIVFCLGVHSLSTLIQETWLARWPYFDFWTVHLITMSVVVLGCSFVVDAIALLSSTPQALLFSIAAALPLAWVAIQTDRAIVRGIARHRSGRGRRASRQRQGLAGALEVRSINPAKERGGRKLTASLRDGWTGPPPESPRPFATLGILLGIGTLEEVIYRGFLVQFCLMIPDPLWAYLALAGTAIVFGLTHVQYGWPQVFAKIPLSALALAPVLVFDTIVPAIIVHAIFNWQVWYDTEGDLRTVFRSTLYPSW